MFIVLWGAVKYSSLAGSTTQSAGQSHLEGSLLQAQAGIHLITCLSTCTSSHWETCSVWPNLSVLLCQEEAFNVCLCYRQCNTSNKIKYMFSDTLTIQCWSHQLDLTSFCRGCRETITFSAAFNYLKSNETKTPVQPERNQICYGTTSCKSQSLCNWYSPSSQESRAC